MKQLSLFLSIVVFVLLGCGSAPTNNDSKNQKTESSVTENTEVVEENNTLDPVVVDKESGTDIRCTVYDLFQNNNIYYATVDYEDEDPTQRTFQLAESIDITLCDVNTGSPIPGVTIQRLVDKDLAFMVAKMTVKDGIITKIVQVFVP